MVVIKPSAMPKFSSITLTIGAKQLVVHEALLMMVSVPSKISSLTPKTMVLRFPVAGAEITTFLAPACKCKPAFSSEVKKPVLSKTTSTPKSPQGRALGSLSA